MSSRQAQAALVTVLAVALGIAVLGSFVLFGAAAGIYCTGTALTGEALGILLTDARRRR